MFTLIIILSLVICVLLIFAVLIQNPKGGGLSGTFGGAANQMFGYKRTTDEVEKFTWGFIIAIFVLCLGSAAFKPSESSDSTNSRYSPEAEMPSVTAPIEQDQPIEDAGSTDDGAQLPTGN